MTLACSDWMGPIVWGYRFSTGGAKRHTEQQRERGGYENERGIEQERGRERTELDMHCFTKREKVLCWASAVLSKRVPIHWNSLLPITMTR